MSNKKIYLSGEKTTVYRLLSRQNHSGFDFSCGGRKTCKKCRVKIISGFENLSPLCEDERKYLSAEDIKNHIRLACMCEVSGDICAEIPEHSLEVQTSGIKSIDMSADIYDGTEELYGAAVDIGTTTVAVYIYSLQTGVLIGYAGAENPQRIHGADVISRINYTIEHEEGLKNLYDLIIKCIGELIQNICEKNHISHLNVRKAVFAGNTVMQCLAADINPESIAFAPFTPPTLFDYETGGLMQTYFAPAFASYVGGDIAAGIIASDIDLSDKIRLFLDVGTNGELGLGSRENLIFCAAAAGPAFEGAHIECGTAGIPGAINKLWIEDNKIVYETIGGLEPSGICGSGIIDACAVMLDLGVLDETGLIELENGKNFKISENVYITQKDIREIQLAKSAISAGIATLLHYSGKTTGDIDEVILAGGFGAHINKKSACKIGLIPPELEDKITIAGNAAGMGASAVLLNKRARERIKNLNRISRYIELSGDAFFMEKYIEHMMF